MLLGEGDHHGPGGDLGHETTISNSGANPLIATAGTLVQVDRRGNEINGTDVSQLPFFVKIYVLLLSSGVSSALKNRLCTFRRHSTSTSPLDSLLTILHHHVPPTTFLHLSSRLNVVIVFPISATSADSTRRSTMPARPASTLFLRNVEP